MRSAVLAAGAAGLLLAAVGAVHAQATRPESAEAAAAMERAQRMAANPMRVILQASKVRRRVEADAAPEPVRAGIRTVSTSAAVAAPVVAAAPAPTRAAPAAVLPPAAAAPAGTVTAAAPVSAPAPALSPAEEPAPAPSVPAPASPSPVAAAPAVARDSLATPPATVPLVPPVAAPDAAPDAAPAAQPKLVTMIEPDIPARLLVEGPRVVEIFADLALRTDGSVAGVTLMPGVPRPWQRHVIAALERWRFEPLAAGRVHRVQLVFGE